MFKRDIYNKIIADWIIGQNIQKGLDIIYNDSKLINEEVLRLLSIPDNLLSQYDIDDMNTILIISNILYNNTSQSVLPLEDGVYDLLVVKFKNATGMDVVGAPPVRFPNDIKSKETKELIRGVTYLTEEENNYINNMLFHDDIYKTKLFTPNDMLYHGVTYERTVTKRLKDTSHNNPELVGTLDKAKFVLMKQAKDKGVADDPTVNVLERDFFGKHIEAGIINPYQNIDIIVELKYDGISIEADILNKRIISARTRGDTANDVASDLTPLLAGYYLPDAPELNEVIGVKFEAIMTYDNLEIYSRLKGRTFANGRTAIISWVSSSDAYQYRELVTLVPLATNIKDEYGQPINRLVEVEVMNRWFCRNELLRYSVFSGDLTTVLFQIYRFAQEAEFMRSILPFMYDGIVVSYLDSHIRQILGRKNYVNLYSMAVKFNTLVRETRFLEYQYTIGQNGEITPMIFYNPVEFFGTIHTKSSGHSYGNFKDLSLRPGDILEVEYRNDVMPYVSKKDCYENDNNFNDIIQFPETCPCCGTPLVFTELSARCPNMNCRERSIKRMANMMDKLQINGIAEETIRLLNVYTFHDLMELKLEDISYIGDLTSKSLINQLDKLRHSNIPDYKLVGALGFTDVAANTWKLIFNEIDIEDLEADLYMCYPDPIEFSPDIYPPEHIELWKLDMIKYLTNIRGIGQATACTIIEEYPFFKSDLLYILDEIKYQKTCGMKFTKVRFTGIRDINLVNYLNNNGYDAGEGSVTKDTDILIVPHEGYNTGSKYKKAIQYGITIKPISQFKQELGLE